jgi:hypothetical protein
MDTRVYYGEYTLKHWIELMLKKNIILPKYQRSFVWEKKDVQRLIQSLENGQFVQPITIAYANEENLILDGQQRITSILLACLGYMPNKEKFEESYYLADGDDSAEEMPEKKSIKWTFQELLQKDSNTTTEIEKQLSNDDRYEKISISLSDEFFEKTFLGFSYIIPNSTNHSEIQKFFSTLFRNINYLGRKLSPLESRRSLYFMNDNKENYFEGKILNDDVKEDALCNIKIVEKMVPCTIDFVRYLAILSQFNGLQNANNILVGYSAYNSRENYIADYVSYILELEQESRVDKFNAFKFDDVFPNGNFEDRFIRLRRWIQENKKNFNLDEKKDAFTSWIDADYWLFGLIYWIVFKDKSIISDKGLIDKINTEISDKKSNEYYSKSPNLLKHLRERLKDSIKIYQEYAR